MTRPSREQTFLSIAQVFSLRGTCPRASVGCVIVDNNHIIAHGYNGAPAGLAHCTQVGCRQESVRALPYVDPGCTRAVHAEENAVAYAARVGVRTEGSVMYTTCEPCIRCSRLIVQAGIRKVVYSSPYREHSGIELLGEAGVSVEWHYIDTDVVINGEEDG